MNLSQCLSLNQQRSMHYKIDKKTCMISYGIYLSKSYLDQELLYTLSWWLRPKLDSHLGAILQESIIDFTKPSLADHSLEVVRYDLYFLVRESLIVQLQRAVFVSIPRVRQGKARLILRLDAVACCSLRNQSRKLRPLNHFILTFRDINFYVSGKSLTLPSPSHANEQH